MRLWPEHPRDILRELPWALVATLGLALALTLEHFFVYKQMILPALEITAEPPLWMLGAMFVPELIVSFVAGWRLRSWAAVVTYAIVGATLHEGFHYIVARAGDLGYATTFADPFADFAVQWPAVVVSYACVLGLAGWSARRERQLLAGT
jgi:hypothetical protein